MAAAKGNKYLYLHGKENNVNVIFLQVNGSSPQKVGKFASVYYRSGS
jgi:hypothetical protein